jgi:hypothetical protein
MLAPQPRIFRGSPRAYCKSGVDMPYRAVKANIAESLNILIQIGRKPSVRFVSEVLEIRSYDLESDHYGFECLYSEN